METLLDEPESTVIEGDVCAEAQTEHAHPLHKLVTQAHQLFQEYRARTICGILWTPLLHSAWLSDRRTKVYMKLETEQVTNAFKVRGALNCIDAAVKEGWRKFATASTGNHALAVVHALRLTGGEGVIFLPRNAKSGKVTELRARTKGSNVQVRIAGEECLAAEMAAQRYAKDSGAFYVSPYNDVGIMAGQGTIAAEIIDDLSKEAAPGARTSALQRKCCYVTVGGGGLIAGIASYLKGREDGGTWRVVGCQPHNSAPMHDSVLAGHVVNSSSSSSSSSNNNSTSCKATLSDGSAGDIEAGTATLGPCATLVDAWARVSEADIGKAVGDMFRQHRKVVEGAGGVAIAGFQADWRWRQRHGCDVAVVVACGGNIDVDTFAGLIGSRDDRTVV